MSMTKVGKTALHNKSLVRKLLVPKPFWEKMVARNPKDMCRELNVDVWVLGTHLRSRMFELLCHWAGSHSEQ